MTETAASAPSSPTRPRPAPASDGVVTPDEFRSLFRGWPAGVAVVTTQTAAGPAGLTLVSLCALSLTPPMLLVCLGQSSRTLPALRESRRFAVNLLRGDQGDRAVLFADPTVEPAARFVGVPLVEGAAAPVFADAFAWATCEVTEFHPAGDHVVVIALVTATGRNAGDPLAWYDGGPAVVARRVGGGG